MVHKIKNQSFIMKIISIVLAIILWVVLTYTVNPTTSYKVSGIKVEIKGEELLEEKGLILLNESEIEPVSVKIKGPRTAVLKARSAVTASIDLTNINSAQTIGVYATFDMGVDDVSIDGRNNALITVKIDNLIDKSIPIEVQQKDDGIYNDKDIIVKSECTEENITLKGAESIIGRRTKVIINVGDVSQFKKSCTKEYSYSFQAEEGYSVAAGSFDTVNELPKTLTVEHTVYNKKTVPVKIKCKNKSSAYEYQLIKDETVDIGIAPDADFDIKELEYEFDADKYEEGVEEYTLTAAVEDSDDLFIAEKEITVKLERIPVEPKSKTVKIEVRNCEEGFGYDVAPSTIELTAADIDDDVKAYIDLEGLVEGNYENVEIKIESDGVSHFDYATEYANVRIFRKDLENE